MLRVATVAVFPSKEPRVPESASVIVRTRDKIDTVGATLAALRAQSVPCEIVVVDSGSVDGTLDLARDAADLVVEIRPEQFTYGGALNSGARRASGSVHFALSAHALPTDDRWVERHLQHYADPMVAAVNGERWRPDGRPLDRVLHQTVEDTVRWPYWGFSNTGSSWRADVWRQHAFREDLPACEDKEWSWRVLRAGFVVVYDPAVLVDSPHRRKEGLRRNWQRVVREAQAMEQLGVRRYPTFARAAQEWWSSFPQPSPKPNWVRRLSPHRAVDVFGTWSGARTPVSAGRAVRAHPLGRAASGGDPGEDR